MNTITTSTVTFQDGHLVLEFPYVPEQVAAIKRIAGARWDKLARVWTVPATQLGAVRDFATEYGFQVQDELLRVDLPQHMVGTERLDFENDHLNIYFSYDPVKVKAVRLIPGAKWDTSERRWTVPITSVDHVVRFAQQFHLHLDPDLADHLDDETKRLTSRATYLESLSRAEDADVHVERLVGTLMPFQRAGVAYAAETRKTFIADMPGLGKTIQSIATLEYLDQTGSLAHPCLVVSPPTLVLNWAKEIGTWLPHRSVTIIKDRKVYPEHLTDFVIVGWSNLANWRDRIIASKYASFIFDESHSAKNKDAARTKAAIKITRKLDADTPVLLLTGTPITNRPAEYVTQLQLIDHLSDYGGAWPFLQRYCAAYQNRFGQWDLSGASNLEELNERLRQSCYVRRTKEQVLADLPRERHVRLDVDPDSKVMRQYQQAHDDIASYVAARAAQLAMELGKNPRSAAVIARIRAESNEMLVRITALKRLAALAKMPAAFEWIDARIDEGQKVVVAAHHRDVVDTLADKYGGLKIQGGMKPHDVEEAKRRFQDWPQNEAPVIVLSIQAAKLGHTLTAASDILFVEHPWTWADVDQATSRLHRIGQRDAVLATHMLADGTIDDEIWKLLEDKRRIVEAATEGIVPDTTIDYGPLFAQFL